MKKFALGILSVFMICGVLLSACDKKISLSVSTQEVTIFTNDANAENFKEANIDVSVENSSAGIYVEVIEGQGVVHAPAMVTRKSGDVYSFAITADTSGQARIRVSAIEDIKQSKEIFVQVNTITEGLGAVQDNNPDGRTDLFVVKGIERQLVTEKYFDFQPVTANIKDIDWSIEVPNNNYVFDAASKSLKSVQDDAEVARIENNKLLVSEVCTLSEISLRASFVNNGSVSETVYNTVKFAILENSTINKLTLNGFTGEGWEDVSLIENDEVVENMAKFDLKRNDATRASVSGQIVVNTEYGIKLKPSIFRRNLNGTLAEELSADELAKYFKFNILRSDISLQQATYTFVLSALDETAVKQFGNFAFFLKVGYRDFNFDLSSTSDLRIDLDTSYAVEGVELTNDVGETLNNATIDVYSNYAAEYGYQLRAFLNPSDVAVDVNLYRVSLDVSRLPDWTDGSEVSQYFKLLDANGNEIKFAKGDGQEYVTNRTITSGDKLYLRAVLDNSDAAHNFANTLSSMLSGVKLNFVPDSDPSKLTTLNLNLFKIASGETFDAVTDFETGESLQEMFLSSTRTGTRSKTYRVKIDGINAMSGQNFVSGLTLATDGNQRFEFSNLRNITPSDKDENEEYVVVEFDVSLVGYDFESSTSFWFEHVTGKKSLPFNVSAFVPLTSASIKVGNNMSSNVYINKTSLQSFVESDGALATSTLSSESLTHLLVEAGSTIPLTSEYQSLANGVEFKFLSFENFANRIAVMGLEESAEELFVSDGWINYIQNSFNDFVAIGGLPFTINENRLTINDNGVGFKGFVLASFDGFDENHQPVTAVRIFALESFYAVNMLSSNVREKVLFTKETLSESEMARSYVDVTIFLRADQKVPTYSNNLSYFTFQSAIGFAQNDAGNATNEILSNDFYEISDIRFMYGGSALRFRVTAKSTQLQQIFDDTLTVIYADGNGLSRRVDIQLEIKNVARVEKVDWTNRTLDGQIYLNLTSSNMNERTATISTAISPVEANDKALGYVFAATSGNASNLRINTSEAGQTFNLSFANNLQTGVAGNLYVLPKDMIKNVNGTDRVLAYKFVKDAEGNILTDESGNEIVRADYDIQLVDLNRFYDQLIDGSDEYANFFYNNDGEKIFNRHVLLQIGVTIADGLSQETAIRIYTAQELARIDTAKYYQIMNNLTLSGWDGFDNFSGMIFGVSSLTTLTFTSNASKNSDVFVKNNRGTIKNLTFAGNISSSDKVVGFVAGRNSGTIENVVVDVYYTNNSYQASMLSATIAESGQVYVGGIVGENTGSIRNSFTYGLSIKADNANFTGGIAGKNSGLVESSGVEFYNFADGKINNIEVGSGGAVGGIVGLAATTSRIVKSYAYAYPFENQNSDNNNPLFKQIIQNGSGTVGLFMASNETGASVEESFAFLGDLIAPTNSAVSKGNLAKFENSYFTYKNGTQTQTNIFDYVEFSYSSKDGYSVGQPVELTTKPNEGQSVGTIDSIWRKLNTKPYSDIWQAGEISNDVWTSGELDENINFGFMYLKNVAQNVALNANNVSLEKEVSLNGNSQFVQALGVDEIVQDGKTVGRGILFLYQTTVETSNAAEQNDLTTLNTISFMDLFNVSESQARTMLVTTTSNSIAIEGSTIRVRSANLQGFTLTVHSKMDFTQSKDFQFVVLNNLPMLNATVNGIALNDGETLLLQKGKTLDVVQSLDYSLNLRGTQYQTVRGDYAIGFDADGQNAVSVDGSGNLLVLTGKTQNQTATINTFVTQTTLDEKFAKHLEVLQQQRAKNFNVSVYEGATALFVQNTTNVSFTTSEYAVIDVVLVSDNNNDNLAFELKYNDRTFTANVTSDTTSVSFAVGSKLTLDVSWTKLSSVQSGNEMKYRVVARVNNAHRHLIDQDYVGLVLSINALSQNFSGQLVKTVELSVHTQEIEDIRLQTYSISSRSIRNSTMYYRVSNNIISTITPGSDAIVSVAVSPAFSLMTHFTLTYETVVSTSGTVNISRLAEGQDGFFITPAATTTIENGIRVNLTDADRTGDGIYYFRIYVSSAFNFDSDIKLTATFFNNDSVSRESSLDLSVDFMPEASVKVGGATNYLLSKGDSAVVTVTTGLDQTLYGLYLQNQGQGIDLSTWTMQQQGMTRVYTAYVTAYVDATTRDRSGVFYVCADVERVVNGVQEIKTSTASVCLVDFSLGVTTSGNKVTSGISVHGSGATATYNGNTYDVLYSYVGTTDDLVFDYTLLPENYNFNQGDASQADAVREMQAKKERFLRDNNYADPDIGYYINNRFDSETGTFEALTLKQQLSYASNENTSWAIYNENYDSITQHDSFDFVRDQSRGREILQITGKKSGRQLMKLTTTVIFQNTEFVYDYYFLVVVDLWSDEETPTIITSGAEFVDFATNSEQADDYILMNDIVLDNYTPLDTDLINSLDGNGFTIHLNSFAMPDGNSLNLALFNSVREGTTLKNVRVNIYGAGQIDVDVTQYSNINIAGFAIENEGVIYNCEVVSYRSAYQNINYDTNGIVVKYMLGAGTDAISLTQGMLNERGIESTVVGFAITNSGSIISSRVGGESFKHIAQVAGTKYLQTQALTVFTIEGQMNVSGFVSTNGGNISASFAKNMEIQNSLNAPTSQTAGFALSNTKNIQNSYVEGLFAHDDKETATGTKISSIGHIAGFVYTNSGAIKNAYSNISIDNDRTKPSYAAGFVYENQTSGQISLCYTACTINNADINQMMFSGVDDLTNSLNFGSITNSYFYSPTIADNTKQGKLTSGATPVHNILTKPEDSLYGFSFASGEEGCDGIWEKTKHGISLVSANRIAFSNRYAVTSGNLINIFYTRQITEASTLRSVDISYGSKANPIIIRSAYDFAMATGGQNLKEISAYKEYYNDNSVWGSYRFVNDVDMSEIGQNAADENAVKLTTYNKTFSGVLDGNGFTMSNINLGSSDGRLWSYGLFSKLQDAVVMNLNMIVNSVNNAQARVVGTLAGVATDSRIIAISIAPTQTTQASFTSILGNNIVGGVVGMLFGDSVLYDVKADNIQIYSSYNGGNKEVGANDLSNLRSLAMEDGNLSYETSRLSYVGAIAGYVDIYNKNNFDFAKFSSTLQVSDYSIVNVHVEGNVNIYGEVAGGLFGYVGVDTYIYDATLKAAEPSYIIGKNLYAGGIIGENYGALFAVSASYTDEIQNAIEKSGATNQEYQYYNSGTSVQRGQMDIFSYQINAYDAPKYVGGLVGYMGGGYIYVGYSKLNVVSTSAQAVGGIIGRVDAISDAYQLANINQTPIANIYLNDVYASGDLYATAEDGFSGGIVGELGVKNGTTPIVAMKNVMAMNYLSYDGQTLLGDLPSQPSEENIVKSSNHFVLIGHIVGRNALSNPIYLINEYNDAFNVVSGQYLSGGGAGAITVGGYHEVVTRTATIQLEPFGFDVRWNSTTMPNALQAEHVGKLATSSVAYVRFNTYFLLNGWNDAYWVHTQNDLFPHIELIPHDNLTYWDATAKSTEKVLKTIADNPRATIIVRGRVDDNENSTNNALADIDLTGVKDAQVNEIDFSQAISNFSGMLISYERYFGNSLGKISTKLNNSLNFGGKLNEDEAGLIINKSLFESLGSGATIDGLNIYLAPQIAGGNIDYSLVNSSVDGGLFRNLNIVLNSNVKLTTKSSTIALGSANTEGVYSAGLIAHEATSTSFVDISVAIRRATNQNEGNVDIEIVDDGHSNATVSMGLLAGHIQQQDNFTSMSVQGIKLADNLSVKFTSSSKNLYAGLYAGAISKFGNSSRVSVALNKLDSAQVEVSGDTVSDSVYVGGYAGYISGVTQVALSEVVSDENEEEGNGIVITQNKSADNLFAGMFFGSIASDTAIYSTSQNGTSVRGALYQGVNATIANAQIGGIAGNVGGTTSISSLSLDFSVAKMTRNDSAEIVAPNYIDQNKLNIFAQNGTSYQLSPFVVKANKADNAFGGLFGYAQNGANVSILGNVNLSGVIDVAADVAPLARETTNRVVSVGGMIGKLFGSLALTANTQNAINISVSETNSGDSTTNNSVANVGGVVGWSTLSDNSELAKPKIEIGAQNEYVLFDGIVLSNVDILKFGGAVGLVENNTIGLEISKVAFGGALKVYGSGTNAAITAGGVIGEVDLKAAVEMPDDGTSFSNTISDCLTYGDVFVIYDGQDNNRLASYAFGGIVGKGNSIHIQNCSTIMTNFNSRYVNGSNYSVGAIVGGNDGNTFKDNKYSSGVNLAYQVESLKSGESDNIDSPYGKALENYAGYSNAVSKIDSATNVSVDNILDKFKDFAVNLEEGHKLKPYVLGSEGKTSLPDDLKSLEKTHGISWVALGVTDYSVSYSATSTDALFGNMQNIAFVGNGQILKVTDRRENAGTSNGETTTYTDAKTLGAVANSMGGFETISFNVISNLRVDLDVVADINTKESDTYAYGGVVGKTCANSTIFGVGVTGDLSVGGANNQLELGGIVGLMEGGKIDECFTNAKITYRAAEKGKVSGIANVSSHASAIKATYSAGQIETYVNVPIYTFAMLKSAPEGSIKGTRNLIDCYSITAAKQSIVDATVLTSARETIYFVSGVDAGTDVPNNIVNGCYDVTDDSYTLNNSGKMALSYGGEAKRNDSLLLEGSDTQTPWYFNPYCNYGYATHGFGFLKNVTTYTRTKTEASKIALGEQPDESGKPTITSVVPEYEYRAVNYIDILDPNNSAKNEWFLGVNNAGKLQQMIETVKVEDNAAYTGENGKNYRFVIAHDIDMSKLANNSGVYNTNIGVEDHDLVIDGNNHTLDFSYTEETYVKKVTEEGDSQTTTFEKDDKKGKTISSSLFGNVTGNIENLRLADINVSSTTTSPQGTLAASVTGGLLNVTVIGNLTTTSALAGGVVGTLNGNARAVEAVVNVTATNGGIVGGVVGQLNKNGEENSKIEYSSNSGQIIVTSKVNSGDIDLPFVPINKDGKATQSDGNPNEPKKPKIVVGGVVGYANGATITEVYNANAVLANYTSTEDANNIAGGIVGYADHSSITNSYNTGLVGAGNYAGTGKDEKGSSVNYATGYSFAGGIFGYAKNLSKNVSDCINDGQVEAIGKMDVPEEGTNYTIKYELKGDNKAESMDKYENEEIAALQYDVTLTLNLNKDRQVYAYGIGFVGLKDEAATNTSDNFTASSSNNGSVASGNFTSTNNIKNDGCIGQVSETQTMTFDRQQILDNKNGDEILDFMGKFEIVKKNDAIAYEVNGYDSYGFPNRIYSQDEITRIYAKAPNDGSETTDKAGFMLGEQRLTNDIYQTYMGTFGYSYSSMTSYNNFEGAYTVDGNGNWAAQKEEHYGVSLPGLGITALDTLEVLHRENHKGGIFFMDSGERNEYGQIIYEFNADPFTMAGATKYYSSVRFMSYDDLLKGEIAKDYTYENISGNADFGLDFFDSNKTAAEKDSKENNDNAPNIDGQISAIDKKTESSRILQNVTVDGKATAIVYSSEGLTAAVAPYQYKFTATFDVQGKIDGSVSKRNFSITDEDVQIWDVDNIRLESGKCAADFTVYLDKKVEEFRTFNVKFNYQAFGTVKLGNNNVVNEGDYTYIILQDENGKMFGKDAQSIVSAIQSGSDIYQLSDIGFGEYDKSTKTFTEGALIEGLSGEDLRRYLVNGSNGAAFGYWDTHPFDNMTVSQVAFIRLPKTTFNDAQLKAGLNVVIKKGQPATSDSLFTVSTTKGTSEYEIPNETSDVTLTFDGYQQLSGNFKNTLINTDALEEIDGGVKINLSAFEKNSSGMLAFGNGLYHFNFDQAREGEKWQYGSTETNLQFEFVVEEGNTILQVTGDAEAVETFKENFVNFEVYRKVSSSGIISTNGGLTVDSVDERTVNGWKYSTKSQSVSKNKNFGIHGMMISEGRGQYLGSNLYEESGEGIATEIFSKFGLDFVVKKVEYHLMPTELTIVNESGNASFTKTYTLNDEEISVEKGIWKQSEERTFKEVDAGGKVKIDFISTSVENFDKAQGLDWSRLKYGDQTFVISSGDGADDLRQALDEGVQLCDEIKKLIGGMQGESLTASDANGYHSTAIEGKIYSIYDNGTVGLQLNVNERAELTETSVMYLTNPLIEGGKMFKVSVKTWYYGLDDGGKIIYVDDENEAIKNEDGSIAFTFYMWDYSTVKEVESENGYDATNLDKDFDVIVRYFDDSSLVLDKNDLPNDETTKLQVEGVLEKVEYPTMECNTINLYSGTDITNSYTMGSDNVKVSNVTYSSTNSGANGEMITNGNTVTFKENGIGEFEYEWRASFETKFSGAGKLQTSETENAANFANIILADDVHMNQNIGGNAATAYNGDGHILKYVASSNESVALFKTTNGNISDLVVVGIASLSGDLNENNFAMLSTANNEAEYKNIKLYGNMRNVNAANKVTVSPVGTVAVGDRMTNVKSFISITGLDVDAESTTNQNDVLATLNDKVIKSTEENINSLTEVGQYQSHNILIAGNGANGANGKDSVRSNPANLSQQSKEATTRDRNGENGKTGGNGGDVSVSTETDQFKGFARAGVAGVGGFGGNGANGWFEGSTVLTRGNGGEAGADGAKGSVITGASKTLSTREVSAGQAYSGNSGIDGFGRIANNKYYTSNGGSNKWKVEDTATPKKNEKSVYHKIAFGSAKNYRSYKSWVGDPVRFNGKGYGFSSSYKTNAEKYYDILRNKQGSLTNILNSDTTTKKGTLYVSIRVKFCTDVWPYGVHTAGIGTALTDSYTVSWIDEGMNRTEGFERGVSGKMITISLDPNDGTESQSVRVKIGDDKFFNMSNQEETLKIPTRPTHNFMGYYYGETQVINENGKFIPNSAESGGGNGKKFTDENGKWIYDGSLTLNARWELKEEIKSQSTTLKSESMVIQGAGSYTLKYGFKDVSENVEGDKAITFKYGENKVYNEADEVVIPYAHYVGSSSVGGTTDTTTTSLRWVENDGKYSRVLIKDGILQANVVDANGVAVTDSNGNWIYNKTLGSGVTIAR